MQRPDRGGTWGVLGGTFDPVHKGHISLAQAVCEKTNLTGALFIPAWKHPFKEDEEHASYSQRVKMLQLALERTELLLVNEIEAEKELSGYTLDTLRALKTTYPESAFRFIIGADNLEQIHKWYKPDALLRETPVIAGTRPGYRLHLPEDLPEDRVELVEVDTEDVSSTELRSMIGRGAPDDELRRYLPEKVLAYIRKEELYV